MAVETKYVVVRKGEEKMTFASKKDADAWDKMLDMADAFTDWLQQIKPELADAEAETWGMLLAEQKDAVQHILRTSKMTDAAADKEVKSDVKESDSAPEKKVRAVKAA